MNQHAVFVGSEKYFLGFFVLTLNEMQGSSISEK